MKSKEQIERRIRSSRKNECLILTKENTRYNLEDRITYILSECLNDNSPIGQEHYRNSAIKVIQEISRWRETK